MNIVPGMAVRAVCNRAQASASPMLFAHTGGMPNAATVRNVAFVVDRHERPAGPRCDFPLIIEERTVRVDSVFHASFPALCANGKWPPSPEA